MKMKKSYIFIALIAGGLCSTPLHAALSWSSQVPKPPVAEGGGHGHGGHGRSKSFYLSDAQGAETEIWFPTLVRRSLSADGNGVVKVGGTGVNNYHLLYARKKSEGRDELALRYHYLNGKPTGESPRLLVGYRKGALDIVPSPLTREHQRYQSGKVANYTVLFKNKPLAKQAVVLTTSNGSELTLLTDAQGELSVALPDDFSDIRPGRRANKAAEFVLSTNLTAQGTEYTTTLSADYHVNPAHWQSGTGGLLAMLVGFAGGLVVLRRTRNGVKEQSDA